MPVLYRRSGSETPVNTTFTGVQSVPAITRLNNGNYVVVWRDDNFTDARGQIFSETGVKVGGEFLLHSAATGTEIAPKVAALSDGGFVAVWSDTIGDGGSSATGIHGQRFDADGVPVGTEFQVNTVTVDGAQTNPNVAGLEDGRFVVTWTDPASSNEIKAAVFAADGTPEVAEIAVTSATPAQNNSTVTMLDDGSFVIAWTNGNSILARAYTAAGAPEAGVFTVSSTSTVSQVQPSITALVGGGFVVTWSDQTTSVAPLGTEIRARIYGADGLPVDDDFVVNSRTLMNQQTPSVAALTTGGFVIVWDDASGQEGETNDNGSRGIKAQVFTATGEPDGAEFLVNTTVAQNQITPVVTALANGGFAISWQDFGGLDGNGAGIVTQTYEPFDVLITDLVASTVTLSETPIQNNPVATLTGVGAVNADFTYTLTGDTTGGAFEIRGNQLFAVDVSRLDFETAPNPQVTIEVTDQNGHSYEETLTLTLADAATERPMQAGDDILVNTLTAGLQTQAEIAALDNGGFIVVWTDLGEDSGSIKAQRFDADGDKVGVEFKVNTTDGATTPTSTQTGANVVGLQDGGFFVTWTHFLLAGSETQQELRGQIFNADGSARGGEFLIGQPINGANALSVLAVTDAGDIVVAWRSGTLNTPSGQGDVMARIYDPDGIEVKATFAIANPSGNQGEQSIVATDDGGFVVAWRDDATPGTIKMRFFDENYDPRTAEIVVNTATADTQTLPQITRLSNDNYVVTWSTQVRNPALNYDVHHRIFDADGNAVTGELQTNALSPTIQNDSRVVALDNGEFVIFWTDNSSSGPANVIGQRFGADGLPIGEQFYASQEILYAQGSSGVASLGGDRFVYLWGDSSGIGGDDSNGGLKVRIFDAVSNDPPVLTDLATAITVLEDQVALIDADVSLSDPEDNFSGGSVTVTGLLGTDVVSIRDVGTDPGEIGVSGTDVTYGGTIIGSVSGGAGATLTVTLNGAATSAAVEALIENLQYANGSDTPVASRDLTVAVADGLGETSSGIVTVNVTAVNDAPVNTVPADGAISVLEGQAIAVTGMQVNDADAGASPTISINLFTDQGYLHVDESVPGGASVIGNDGGNPSPVVVYGTLAQVNATLAALNGVTLHVGPDYFGPVTIGLTSSDGGATGEDPGGAPGMEFDFDQFVIDVLPVNDAPELDLDLFEPGNNAAAAFVIGDGPITLAPFATFSDDNTSFDGAKLTVSLTANGTADDQLRINNVGTGLGEIAVAGNVISYEGVDVATFTGGTNGTDLVITFNAAACHCAIETVMYNVSFEATGPAPAAGQRTIEFELVDGGGIANGGADTGTAEVTVDVTAAPSVHIDTQGMVPVGGEVAVAGNEPTGPAATTLADGSYVIAWFDATGVFFRHYDADGTPLSGATHVATATDFQFQTDVVALADGGYALIYVGQALSSTPDVRIQRYDADDNPVGTEVTISDAGRESGPVAAVLADGSLIVAWQTDSGDDIHAQLFDSTGAAVAPVFTVNTFTTGLQSLPEVAALGDGGFRIVWASANQDGSGNGVYSQLYDADGVPVGGETLLNMSTAGSQQNAVVAALDGQGEVIVWEDGGNIIQRVRDPDTGVLGGEVRVNTDTIRTHGDAAVTRLDDGGYVVSWVSQGQDGDGGGIYAQRFDRDGNPVGGEFRENATTAGSQIGPALTGLEDGYVATWASGTLVFGEGRIFAQRFVDGFLATEQVALDLKGSIHVADLDTTGDVTVTLTVGYGTLAIDPGTSGVDVTELFPDEFELVGTVAEIEALLNTDGTSTITYIYDNDYPPPSDTLIVTIDDGSSTSTDTAQIAITPVNDAPDVDLDFFAPGDNTALTWTEGDGPTLLAPFAIFDDDNGDDFDGAILTVTIAGATTGDQLTIDDIGTGAGELGVSGSNVTYEGVVVGSFTGGANGAPLVITFNDEACHCAVELAMASILYENSDDLTAASSRTVDFTLVDGAGTALGGADTDSASVALDVLPAADVITGADAVGDEDTDIAITGVAIDGLAADPAGDVVTVRLSVAHGTLDIRTDVGGGIGSFEVTGDGSGHLIIISTQDKINATLAASGGLIYRGEANFNGTDALTVEAADASPANSIDLSVLDVFDLTVPIAGLAFRDLDQDGTDDAVVGIEDAVLIIGSVISGVPLTDPGTVTGFAFADFDGDGIEDIGFAAANAGSGHVGYASSLTGDAVKIADIAFAGDLVTGDFDGNGLADLAVTDGGNGRVAILLQDSVGSFLAPAYSATTTNLNSTLVTADFNGDGELDLLVGSSGTLPGGTAPGSVELMLGNGDGSFQVAAPVLTTAANVGGIALGDFNEDGAMDFAFASSGAVIGVQVVLGNGDGTFAVPVIYMTSPDGAPSRVVAADLNGDGFVDLAVANQDDPGSISLLIGDGGGIFQDATDFDTDDNPSGIIAGDPDDDGDTDLIVGTLDGLLDLINNDGTFRQVADTKTIIVNSVDDPGVARPDAFTITEAGTIAGDLFADNGAGVDADVDDPLAVTAVNGSLANVGTQITLASGALLTVNADGTFDYDSNGAFLATPAPGSGASNTPGHDSFTYRLQGGNTVTVLITLTGLDGDDVLRGTAGADLLAGGGGNDAYYIENAADQVLEGAGAGSDRVFASTTWTLTGGAEVELLTTANHAATTAINLTGNALANLIMGNDGDNTLNGGGGADTLVGRLGNDFYQVDNIADRVIETTGQGSDRVFASMSYTLAAGVSVETLSTTANAGTGAIDLTGNELANTVQGNDGMNILDGRGGADTLIGLLGDDWYYVDNSADRVVEAASGGNDRVFASTSWTLSAGAEVELLTTDFHAGTAAINLGGNALANTIYGNAGANVLNGQGGNDVLVGLGGADGFSFTTALGATNVDRIVDFVSGSDKILLDDAIFTQAGGLGTLGAAAFHTGSAAHDASDRIVYNQATGQLFYDADGNGAGAAVLFATLQGAPVISASDFLII